MKYLKFILVFCVSCLFLSCNEDTDSMYGEIGDGVGGSLATFVMKNEYLYVVDNQNLNVFSIHNPQNPVKVNSVPIGFNIETMYLLRNYLFIGSQNGMFIYSIENPENPVYLSGAEHFNACDPVVANTSNAFVTLHSNTNCGNNINVLQVYDTTDLQNPVLIHQRNLTHPKGLALHEQYLLVCDDELKIFSIANPVLVHSVNKSYKDLVIYQGILFAFGENEITQYKWTAENFSDLEVISSLSY